MGLCRCHPFQGVPAGWYIQVNGGQSPHRSISCIANAVSLNILPVSLNILSHVHQPD